MTTGDEERLEDLAPVLTKVLAAPAHSDHPEWPEVSKDGVDLGPHQASLRRMLRRVQHFYEQALDDWLARNGPDRPDPVLEKNWHGDDPDCPHDYGEDIGAGLEGWDEHHRRFHGRGRGNPGGGRLTDAPTLPLRSIYRVVDVWWEKTVGRNFYPYFSDGEGDMNELHQHSPDARLLLVIARDLDRRYTGRQVFRQWDNWYRKTYQKHAPK